MKGVKEDCKELQKLDDAVILESFGISRSLVKHAKPKCYMYDWYVGEMDHAEDLDKDGGVNDTYMNDRGMRDVQEECKHTNPWFEIVSVNSGVKIRTLPDDYPLVHVLSSRGLPEDYFSVERLKRLFLDQYTKSLRKFLPHSTETELVHCARTSSDVFFVPHVLPHLRCTTDKQFRRLIDNMVCYVLMGQSRRSVITMNHVERFAASPLMPIPIVSRATVDLGDTTYTLQQLDVLDALPTQDRCVRGSRLDVCTALISLIQQHIIRLTKKVAPVSATKTPSKDDNILPSSNDFDELISSWPQSCAPRIMEQTYSLPKSVRSLNVNKLLEAVELIAQPPIET